MKQLALTCQRPGKDHRRENVVSYPEHETGIAHRKATEKRSAQPDEQQFILVPGMRTKQSEEQRQSADKLRLTHYLQISIICQQDADQNNEIKNLQMSVGVILTKRQDICGHGQAKGNKADSKLYVSLVFPHFHRSTIQS